MGAICSDEESIEPYMSARKPAPELMLKASRPSIRSGESMRM
jgi:uncharacterized protein YegL